jgi:hypothetical protein
LKAEGIIFNNIKTIWKLNSLKILRGIKFYEPRKIKLGLMKLKTWLNLEWSAQ